MNFQLKTTKETLNLAFNSFFIGRVCELSGCELSDVFGYLMGKNISTDKDNPNVNGGLINNMEVRANVIAAGIDSYNAKQGDYTKTSTMEGYSHLDNLSLIDGQFSEMYGSLIDALLPNAEAVEEKAAKAVRKPALKKSKSSR